MLVSKFRLRPRFALMKAVDLRCFAAQQTHITPYFSCEDVIRPHHKNSAEGSAQAAGTAISDFRSSFQEISLS